MSELFTDNMDIDPNKDYSSELVGEGKKYKDWQSAARALMEKEAHIKRTESENKALREDLQKRVTLEEVMTKISQNKQEVLSEVEPNEAKPAPGLTREQLEALIDAQVEQRITKDRSESVAERNVNQVTAVLKQAWGENFSQVLAEKTQELGLNKEWVTDLARNQPKALLTLVGIDKAKPVEPVLPVSSINTSGFSAAPRGEKTMSYYKDLKVKDPVKYFSKAVQKEMMDQGMKLGEAFFDA